MLRCFVIEARLADQHFHVVFKKPIKATLLIEPVELHGLTLPLQLQAAAIKLRDDAFPCLLVAYLVLALRKGIDTPGEMRGGEVVEPNDCRAQDLGDRLRVPVERNDVDRPVDVDDVPPISPDEGVAVEDVASTLAPAVEDAADGHDEVRGLAVGAQLQHGAEVAALGVHGLPGAHLAQIR